MPKIPTYQSQGEIQVVQNQRANPRMMQNAGMIDVNGGMVSGNAAANNLRDILLEAPIDRVERDTFAKAADLATAAFETSLKIADQEAQVNAAQKQSELTTQIRSLLWDGDSALYSKTGQEFIKAAPQVKQQVEQLYNDAMESASPRERFHLFDFVTADRNSKFQGIASEQVQQLEVAKESARSRMLTDFAISAGKTTNTEQLKNEIASATAAILPTLPNDPNIQVQMVREIVNFGFESKVAALTSMGKTPREKMANHEAASQLLEDWKKTPAADPMKIAKAEENIVNGQDRLIDMQEREELRGLAQAEKYNKRVATRHILNYLLAQKEGDPNKIAVAKNNIESFIYNPNSDAGAVMSVISATQDIEENKYASISPEVMQEGVRLASNPDGSAELFDFTSKLRPEIAASLTSMHIASRDKAYKNELVVTQKALGDLYDPTGMDELNQQKVKGAIELIAATTEKFVQANPDTKKYELLIPQIEKVVREYVRRNPPAVSVQPKIFDGSKDKILATTEYNRALETLKTRQMPQAQSIFNAWLTKVDGRELSKGSATEFNDMVTKWNEAVKLADWEKTLDTLLDKSRL